MGQLMRLTSSMNLGVTLGQMLPGRISGVGHSLGGGLNTVAALRGNFPAVNFNAAGVHLDTATELGINLNGAMRLVVNYSEPGDFLTRGVNRTYLAPSTDGQQVLLPSADTLPLGINRHRMVNVIPSIQKLLKENGCN